MTQAPDDEFHRVVLRPYRPVDENVLADLAAESVLVTEAVAADAGVWPETAPAAERLASWSRLLTAVMQSESDGPDSTDDPGSTDKSVSDAEPVPAGDVDSGPSDELWVATAQLVYSLGRDPMPAGLPALLLATAAEDEETFDLLWMTQNLPEMIESITVDWLRAGVLGIVAGPGSDRSSAELEDVNDLLDGLTDFVSDETDTDAQLMQPLVDAVKASPIVQLTPLGDYGLRQILLANGWPVPLVGSYRDVPAAELLDQLEVHVPDDVVVEAELWLEARGDQWSTALLELADSARSADPEVGPVRRAVLGAVLRTAGPRVAPVLDDLSDDLWLSAIAAGVRTGLGIGPPLNLKDDLWLTVDGLSGALSGDEEERADAVEESDVLDILSEPGAVHTAMQLSHPLTHDVLRMIAEVGGDRQLTQRLRRALSAAPQKNARKR